jgi:ribonuclease P protein component
MVEAWRLNKHSLISAIPPGAQLHVFLIFTGKEMPKYDQVLSSVKTGIEKLITIVKNSKA